MSICTSYFYLTVCGRSCCSTNYEIVVTKTFNLSFLFVFVLFFFFRQKLGKFKIVRSIGWPWRSISFSVFCWKYISFVEFSGNQLSLNITFMWLFIIKTLIIMYPNYSLKDNNIKLCAVNSFLMVCIQKLKFKICSISGLVGTKCHIVIVHIWYIVLNTNIWENHLLPNYWEIPSFWLCLIKGLSRSTTNESRARKKRVKITTKQQSN